MAKMPEAADRAGLVKRSWAGFKKGT